MTQTQSVDVITQGQSIDTGSFKKRYDSIMSTLLKNGYDGKERGFDSRTGMDVITPPVSELSKISKKWCKIICYKGQKRAHVCKKGLYRKGVCYYHYKKKYPWHKVGVSVRK